MVRDLSGLATNQALQGYLNKHAEEQFDLEYVYYCGGSVT